MISDSTYHAIWDGLLEVCRIRRYSILCERKYQRFASAFQIALAFSCVGVLVSLVEIFNFLPVNTTSFFAILILVLMALEVILNPSKVAVQLICVNSMLSELEDEYRELWAQAKGNLIADGEALDRKCQIMQKVSRACSFADVSVDNKLNRRAQIEAFQTEKARYAGLEISATSTAR